MAFRETRSFSQERALQYGDSLWIDRESLSVRWRDNVPKIVPTRYINLIEHLISRRRLPREIAASLNYEESTIYVHLRTLRIEFGEEFFDRNRLGYKVNIDDVVDA